MEKFSLFGRCTRRLRQTNLRFSSMLRSFCTAVECPETRELVEYLDSLKNYEKSGVPENAGTDTDDGFDLGRMRRLMRRLGNPQSKYKVIHIGGTKGKGSTAAFLSNILRAEGYSVGCYTSPHIRTIRERMSLGTRGEMVSGYELYSLFHRIKKILDQAVAHENGRLSYFEILTAIAFTLFADQNVDIAVVEAGLGGARDATNVISSSELAAAVITTIGKEHLAALGGSLESITLAKSGIIKHGCPVILGGPFLPHTEQIIRDKAESMCSLVISASDCGSRSFIKGFGQVNGEPCQCCDIIIQIENEMPLSIELRDLNLSMLGRHQLQNAVTATCAALCLRDQGWKISDRSVRTALESTRLLGRSQFLKREEAETLGLPGSMVLLDGAHTRESAKALANTISMACQSFKLVLVVAMASDKDHIGFAREFLSGLQLEAIFITEVDIAGDKSRTTSALRLKDIWTKSCLEHGIEFICGDNVDRRGSLDMSVHSTVNSSKVILTAESSLPNCLTAGHRILKARTGGLSGKMRGTSYFYSPATSCLMQNLCHDCRKFGACIRFISYPSNRANFNNWRNNLGSSQNLIQSFRRNRHDYVYPSSKSVCGGKYSVLHSSGLQHWFKNWQDQRKNKLTASTFSIAIGFWPRRRVQLWLEKIGAIDPFTGNLATCWNNIKEEEALERYKLITGNTVLFPEFQIHGKSNCEEDDWLAASPDGVVENIYYELPSRGVLEIKCPFFDGDMSKAFPWKRIPLHCMPQAQGLMEILDRDWMDFYVWTPKGSSLFRLYRDQEYWDNMKIALSDFWWKHVQPAKELYNKSVIKTPITQLSSLKPEPRHELCSFFVYESKRLVDNSRLLVREINGRLQEN